MAIAQYYPRFQSAGDREFPIGICRWAAHVGGISNFRSEDSKQMSRQELRAHPHFNEPGGQHSLQILMCRYAPSGKPQKSIISVHDTEYFAISHAWGDTHWEQIPGHDEPLLVSKSKAQFIAERLPEIVGDSYFWMDVMCVDQHNAEARVAVTRRSSETRVRLSCSGTELHLENVVPL